MIKTHPVRRRDFYLLCIILFIAAVMRFMQPSVVEFFHDDGMLASLAQRVAGGELLLTGINSSVGIPNPPTSVYLTAIPFAISDNPLIAILFVMGLNVIGVGILWLIAHRYFGRTVALIAGLTYAVSPWAVLFSRKIWAQELHTPFILLAILLGIYGFWELRERDDTSRRFRYLDLHILAQVFCLPVLVFGMQMHFGAWLLLPLYFILLIIGRKQISWRALIVSLVLTVLILLPYGLGLSNTLSDDPTRISDAIGRSEANTGLSFTLAPIQYIAYLSTGLGIETWVAPDQQSDLLIAIPPISPLWAIILIFMVLGVWGILSKDKRIFAPLIFTWAFLSPLVFIPVWTPVYIHYFIPMIPAYALLAGIGFDWLTTRLPYQPTSRTVFLAMYAVILLTQAIWWTGLLRFLDKTDIAYPGFTTPMSYLSTIRDNLLDKNDVVVLSYGMAWNLHHESVIWDVMLGNNVHCTRTLQGEGYAVFPDHPFTVLIAPDAPPSPVYGIYENDNELSFPVRAGGGEYITYEFEVAPEWQETPIQSIEPVLFESGVQLTGYHLTDDKLVLEWQLPAPIDGLNYQYSGKFLDEDGSQLGQYDTSFWMGRHWCAGDRLLTIGDTNIPAETATLSVSLYELGTGKDQGQFFDANIIDEMGNPIGVAHNIPIETPNP